MKRFFSWLPLVLMLLIISVVGAACAGNPDNGGGGAQPPPDAQVLTIETSDATERKIVYEVDCYLVADDLLATRKAIADDLTDKEFIEREQVVYGADYDIMYLTVRIRSSRVEAYKDFLYTLGTVDHYDMTATDVTLEYNNVSALLEAARIKIASYQTLLEQESAKPSPNADLIETYLAQIEDTNAAINRYMSQVNTMTDASNYSTVELTVTETYEEYVPTYGEELGGAFKGGWHFVGVFFKGLFKVILAVLPSALILAAILCAIFIPLRLTRTKRQARRMAKQAAQQEALRKEIERAMPPQPRFDPQTGERLDGHNDPNA